MKLTETVTAPTFAANVAMHIDHDDAPAPLAITPAGKVADLALVRALRALRTRMNPDTGRQWSNSTIASALGLTSDSYVSTYLNQVTADGAPNANAPALTMDLGQFEDRVRQFLDTLADRKPQRRADSGLFSTAVTRQVMAFCREIRAARQWGLIHGLSGMGKTSGLRAFAQGNPAAIHLSAVQWGRGAPAIEEGLLRYFNRAGSWRNNTKRMSFVRDKLAKADGVMLLIDNAQKLTPGALHLIADLRDEFTLPVVMAGTKGVLDTLQRDAQLATRIDESREADWGWEFQPGDSIGTRDRRAAQQKRDACDALLKKLCPDHADALRAEARKIMATEEGTMRALAKRLQRMLALLDHAPNATAPEAFAAACAQLLSSAA